MRRLISLVTASALLVSIPASAYAAPGEPAPQASPAQVTNAAEPRIAPAAKKTTVKTTAAGLLNGLNVAPPLYVGYKAGEFLPVGAKSKRDKRGCTYAKQMLISLAIKKPKVGKKCKLTGGTWSVNFGTKIQKGSKGLKVVPIIDDKSAWGQGASSWTPEQRAAWAKNNGGGTPTTRVQSTNHVVTAAYLKEVNVLAKAGATATRSMPGQLKSQPLTVKPTLTPAIIIGVLATAEIIGGAVAIADNDDDPDAPGDVYHYCGVANPLVDAFLANSAAWGLSIDGQVHQLLGPFFGVCPSKEPINVAFESAIAATTFSVAGSSTSNYAGVGVSVGGGSGTARATEWQTFSDYGTPSGGVIPGDLFGIHVPDIGSQPRPAGSFPNIPVGYVRLWDSNTSWRSLEPNVNGTYEWTTLDLAVQRIRDSGAKVMMVLGYTPRWASASGEANAAPSNPEDYSEYVRSVACRYGNAVSSYEVWNEGNLDTFWTGTPEQLADLTQRAYTEIKKCSSAEVIAASTGTRASGPFASNFLPYLQALAAKGWPIDGYSVHSYPSASGGADNRLDGLKQFKAMLASTGAPVKPIYDTELNYGLAGLGEPHVDLDQAQSAAAIIRSYVDSVRFGVSSTFWFLWTTGYYDKLGIQLNPTTTLNSVAWTQAWKWLVNSRLQRCSEFTTDATSGVVTACQFTFNNGQNHTIMWTERGKQARVQITGLGTQSCDAWGECLQISGSVNVTEVPLWIGDPGGIYGPATKVDPSASEVSVPDAPSILSSYEDLGSTVTVNLKAPASDGGSPITEYTVSVTDRSGTVTTGSSNTTTVEVPNVRNGVARVTATAKNGRGSSAESQPYMIGSCGNTRGKPLWTFECLDFGTVPVGATKVIPVKVTNQSARMHTLSFEVSPGLSIVAAPSALDLQGACAKKGAALPGKKSCTVFVSWTPKASGALNGATIIASTSVLQAYQGRFTGTAY